MDGSTSSVDGNDIDWNTEDELELDNFTLSPSSSLIHPGGEANVVSWEVSSSPSFSNTKVLDQFIGMGFLRRWLPKQLRNMGKKIQMQFWKPSLHIRYQWVVPIYILGTELFT